MGDTQSLHVTLDTNCLYELDSDDKSSALGHLVELGKTVAANLRIPAIAASERQRPGREITNFRQFRARLADSGLNHAEILKPMLYWDIGFIDWALWCGPETEALELQIHEILFPSIRFLAAQHCPDTDTKGRRKWRNAKCDVQAMWCHIYYHGDVFVTRDRVFHRVSKKPRLEALGAKCISTPEDAVDRIREHVKVSDGPSN